MQLIGEVISNFWKPAIEIIILSAAIYILILYIRGTRAAQVVKGLIFLAILFFLTQLLGLNTINWILTKLFAISVIAFLILFQPELRRGLARIGQNRLFGLFIREEQIIDEIAKSCVSLSRKKIGALIGIERETRLKPYIESGIPIDSIISSELINTIFIPSSPLHDGAIIVEGDRIVAAGCLFPLSQNARVSKTLGTRHLAAIGLTEETDAVTVVVSEETGAISVAIEGKLTQGLDEAGLRKFLYNLYKPRKGKRFTP